MHLKQALLIATLTLPVACSSESCDKNVLALLNPNQTSARLLMDYAKMPICQADKANPAVVTVDAERKLVLVYDLYVKARSYAILNKVFFWLSLVSAIAVFLWPALGVLLKEQLGNREWYKSAIVQTTITAVAALMFAFYSQYKDKQTYTENLMRYAVFADKPIDELAQKVIEEIGKIDNGFSFTSIVNKEKPQ
ncbi:MAG: hypothetical protein ABL925_07095 [Methylococcales bacterium]